MQPTLDMPSETIRPRKYPGAVRRALEATGGVRSRRSKGHRGAAMSGRDSRRADMRYSACSDAPAHGPVDDFTPLRMATRPGYLVSAWADASRTPAELCNPGDITATQGIAWEADH